MMAKANSEFGRQWFEAYRTFDEAQWDHHSVVLPLQLSHRYPVTVLANDALFYPLWDPTERILLTEPINVQEATRDALPISIAYICGNRGHYRA